MEWFIQINNLSRQKGCKVCLITVFKLRQLDSGHNSFFLSSGGSFTPNISWIRRYLQICRHQKNHCQGLIRITTKVNTNQPYNLSLTSWEEKGFWGLRGWCLANFRYLKGPIYSLNYSQPVKNMWSTITLQLRNINRMNLFSRSISYTYLNNCVMSEFQYMAWNEKLR